MESLIFPLSKKEAIKMGVLYSSEANKNALFPTKLRDLRKEKGISQAALADAIGVTKSTIGLYEIGDNVPDVKTLSKLAHFYGVTSDYLLGLNAYKTPEAQIYAHKSAGEFVALLDEIKAKYRDYFTSLIRMLIEGLGCCGSDDEFTELYLDCLYAQADLLSTCALLRRIFKHQSTLEKIDMPPIVGFVKGLKSAPHEISGLNIQLTNQIYSMYKDLTGEDMRDYIAANSEKIRQIIAEAGGISIAPADGGH